MTGLSERHRRFVDEYCVDTNAAAAARRAGFSARSAGQLMKIEAVRTEIARRQEVEATEAKVSLSSLLDEAERARTVAAENGNAAAMVAATNLKARLTGRLSPDSTVSAAGEDQAERQDQQRSELRKAGRLLADAAVSLGLPRDATPAQIVGAVSQVAIATPEAFELMRAAHQELADAG